MPPPPFLKRIALDPSEDAPSHGYPFDLAAVRNLGERELRSPVTAFVGENGSGKSTLLEAIAVGLGMNAEGGSKNLRFETRNSHSDLHRWLLLTRSANRPRDAFFLRAESFYNTATAIEGIDPAHASYGGKPLHHMSHGESFLTLVTERFGGPGIYLMDEPEAALSPQRQLALLARIHQLVQQGSQFLLATHSPMLLAWPGTDVWQFEDDGIRSLPAEETEHWQLMRRFLQQPRAFLDELLRE